MNACEISEDLDGLLDAVDHLAKALDLINRHGDEFDRNLAVQADGCAYGDAYRAMITVLSTLFPAPTCGPVHRLANRIADWDGDVRAALRSYVDEV